MNTKEKKNKLSIRYPQEIIKRSLWYLFTVLLIFYSISGCSFSKKKYSIQTDSLQVYGDNANNLIAWIADFHYRNGKIYIWDSVQLKMFIYSINGKLIKKVKYKEGKGPGELSKSIYYFDIISDTTLVFLDFMQKRIQFISTNGNYIKEFHTQFTPWQIFYRNNLLYIVSVDFNALIHIYTLDGKDIGHIVKPFNSIDKSLMLPFANIEDDLSVYYGNTTKTEISKWQNDKFQWKFKDENLGLISSTSLEPSKGIWLSIFTYKDFLIASASPGNPKIGETILLLDKNTGDLLSVKRRTNPFFAKSFEKGKYIFIRKDAPYPHLNRINLKIVKK